MKHFLHSKRLFFLKGQEPTVVNADQGISILHTKTYSSKSLFDEPICKCENETGKFNEGQMNQLHANISSNKCNQTNNWKIVTMWPDDQTQVTQRSLCSQCALPNCHHPKSYCVVVGYGNTGCGVFKGGIQNHILIIGVMVSCKKLSVILETKKLYKFVIKKCQ